MRHHEALQRARLYTAQPENEPTCLECLPTLGLPKPPLQPLHVDDKSGVDFLICPLCGAIYTRPYWYETPEERLIRGLIEKIANLEARITALERSKEQPQRQIREQQRTQPKREENDEGGIMLPNLRTV